MSSVPTSRASPPVAGTPDGLGRGAGRAACRGDDRAGQAAGDRCRTGPAGRGVRRGHGLAGVRPGGGRGRCGEHSQPLTADAASIYRSLADADTTAAAGFLAGDEESEATRERYATDIATASALLVKASANSGVRTGRARRSRSSISRLPRYAGLVETARTNNRQGLPLGGAYLRYANEQMRTELLPAARALYDAETDRLAADYGAAKAWPWWALAAGVVALGALRLGAASSLPADEPGFQHGACWRRRRLRRGCAGVVGGGACGGARRGLS